MFNNFDYQISNLFKIAEEERKIINHPYVGTEHLLLAILKSDEELKIIFNKYNITYKRFKEELCNIVGNSSKSLEINLYTPMLKRVIANAIDNANEYNNGKVTNKHLIISLLEEGEGIAIRILMNLNMPIDDLYEELNTSIKHTGNKLSIYEYGNPMNKYIDMNEKILGRDKEIELIMETLLRKKKNNPILIGDAGVGKTAIVEELARRINKKNVPESLINYEIISLEMGSLISGTKYRGEFEEKLTKIIRELEENKNIILFIDEIHSMVNAGGAEGAINAADIFKPALARGNIKCIGATTKEEYNKYFLKDKALTRRFEVININEPTEEETKNILLKIKNEYELHHDVKIDNTLINKIIYYTSKYITNKKNPDKSIDFLDSVCSYAKIQRSINNKELLYNKLDKLKIKKEKYLKEFNYENAIKVYKEEKNILNKINNIKNNKTIKIKEEDIISVLENKTNIIINKNKINIINNIKDNINKELYGINDITERVCNLIKNNIINQKGLLKIYLEGEEYLGKSTMVKLIADNYPNSRFIRINLKEYSLPNDIYKLIGNGIDNNYILNKVNNNTFTIILFDNYDYASDNIKDLIKDILKYNQIIDSMGENIYFNNCYIFITNNIERNNKIGFSKEINIYNNDLSNLVDDSIIFKPLTREVLLRYLDSLNIINKDYILLNSNYEKYNYKNIDNLIKKELVY